MPDNPANTETAEAAAEDLNQAELAHSIIEALLDHTRVVSDLIAVMAQALDQDTTKALTQTAQWQAYLESRRQMERTRTDVEKFVEIVKNSKAETGDWIVLSRPKSKNPIRTCRELTC